MASLRALCVVCVLCGYKLLIAKIAETSAKLAEKIFPRVTVETPLPPALREERIGKETAAGMVPPACFSFLKKLFKS
jgi:hypothetical protein